MLLSVSTGDWLTQSRTRPVLLFGSACCRGSRLGQRRSADRAGGVVRFFSCAGCVVSVARRLALARAGLPEAWGCGSLMVTGQRRRSARSSGRTPTSSAYLTRQSAQRLERLASRFVAPMAVAPLWPCAAVDLTLVGQWRPASLTSAHPSMPRPRQSSGACYFDAPLARKACARERELLAQVLPRRRPGELPDRVVALELR